MEAYKDMLRAGFKADVYTYSSLIQACQCCNSRWKDASRFFDQMKIAGMFVLVKQISSEKKLLVLCCIHDVFSALRVVSTFKGAIAFTDIIRQHKLSVNESAALAVASTD